MRDTHEIFAGITRHVKGTGQFGTGPVPSRPARNGRDRDSKIIFFAGRAGPGLELTGPGGTGTGFPGTAGHTGTRLAIQVDHWVWLKMPIMQSRKRIPGYSGYPVKDTQQIPRYGYGNSKSKLKFEFTFYGQKL